MTGALIILAVTILIGFVLWCFDRNHHSTPSAPENQESKVGTHHGASGIVNGEGGQKGDDEECCGRHLICEKVNDRFLTEPEYYDDEELDRYAGRSADAYTAQEEEEFRDVLMTMCKSDIVPWTRSLELRGITPPTAIRDEILLLLE